MVAFGSVVFIIIVIFSWSAIGDVVHLEFCHKIQYFTNAMLDRYEIVIVNQGQVLRRPGP